MSTFVTNIKGKVTAVVQGENAKIVMQDGEIISASTEGNRLVKCMKCKSWSRPGNFCTQCGEAL